MSIDDRPLAVTYRYSLSLESTISIHRYVMNDGACVCGKALDNMNESRLIESWRQHLSEELTAKGVTE